MDSVGAGLCHNIHVGARATAVRRIIQTRLHFEFLDGIGVGNRDTADRQNGPRPLRLHIADVLPVHLVAVVHDAAAIDEHIYGVLAEVARVWHGP